MCINLFQAQNILGYNFVYRWIFDESVDKNKTLSFEFINKSQVSNCKKKQFISEKINELEKNGFTDVEDLKISKFGRFIVIRLKTIEDYEKEKIIAEQEYIDKINLINKKISMLENVPIFKCEPNQTKLNQTKPN